MPFATLADVRTAYEGTIPESGAATDRVRYHLDVVNARLRTLLPALEDRIDAAPVPGGQSVSDLAILARDAVVNATLRRMPGATAQQVRSETQSAGPWSYTQTFTTDSTRTFSDEELAVLYDAAPYPGGGAVGTVKLGLADWSPW